MQGLLPCDARGATVQSLQKTPKTQTDAHAAAGGKNLDFDARHSREIQALVEFKFKFVCYHAFIKVRRQALLFHNKELVVFVLFVITTILSCFYADVKEGRRVTTTKPF